MSEVTDGDYGSCAEDLQSLIIQADGHVASGDELVH